MKQLYLKQFVVACVFMLIGIGTAQSIPSDRRPRKITQPDGTMLTIRMQGDEFCHYTTTNDGYTIVQNEIGIYVYAHADNSGNLIPGETVASDEPLRTTAERAYLASVPKQLLPALASVQKKTRKATNAVRLKSSKAFPLTGSPKSLVILAGFSDKTFTVGTPQTAFTNLLNQQGYSENGATGSARDWFSAGSHGILTPNFVVAGPYTLPQPTSYYGANDTEGNDVNPQQMVIDACNLANTDVDFSEYDTDNDGKVDNVFIFYAGYSEAESGDANDVWPHQSTVSETLTLDGKTVSGYSCTSELKGSSGSAMCGIGTFCHELSHTLGLPDLYDTGNSNHYTVNDFAIMASAGYANEGRTPPLYSCHEQFLLGFITPVELSAAATVTLEDVKTSGKAYILSQTVHNMNATSPSPAEFYMLENRQKTGFDAYLPSSGLLIWHINYDATVWEANTLNNQAQLRSDICEADGIADTDTHGADAFPSTGNVTSYTPRLWAAGNTTIPSGADINRPLTNIAENNGVITFDIMGGAPAFYTWNGTGNWNTAVNWSTGVVPPSGSSIIVASGELTVDQSVNSNNFTINAGANVTIASGNTLTVAGNLSLLSGAAATASLINNGTLTVAGTTSAQSYLTGNKWHIVSPTASGQTVAGFLTANTSIPTNTSTPAARGMMDYNTAINDWNEFYPASGAAGSMDAGKGYSVRVVTDGVITFTGLLTSGSKDVTVTRTGDNGWNCVGNPYPSAINMNESAAATDNFISQNSGNLDPSYAAVYIWDENGAYDGTQRYYKVISNSGFTLPVTSLGQNVVQSGQGFLVKVKTGATNISFAPVMQVHSTGTALKSSQVSWPGFELIASSADVKASTVVAFNSAMTKGLDPTYDAGLLGGTLGLELYSRLVDDNGVDFAIQCLPEAYDSLVIPIGLDCAEGGEISFSVGVSNLPATCSVILEDKTAQTFTQLGGGASYKATVVAGATVAGRFYIHTSNLTTGTGELGLTDAFSLKSYIDGDFIRITGKVGRSAKAYLSTVDGRRIGNYNLQEGSLNSIPAAGLAPGVYLLNITDSGNRYSNKIVVYK